jgi:ADP-heptose:LPS heptosyltransferase
VKILIAQQFGLGNAVMTTPLIRALSTIKKTTIHCTYDEKRKAVQVVLGDLPEVVKVHGCRQVDAIIKESFDLVILAGSVGNLKAKYRIPRTMSPMPEISRTVPKEQHGKYFEKHEIEYLMDAARSLGYEGNTFYPYIGKTDDVVLDLDGPKVCLGIGYFKGDTWSPKKHWGNENYARLADDLAAVGAHVFLVGGSMDRVDARQIVALAKSQPRSLVERLSVRSAFGLFQACDCFVGNDTGFAHAAAALERPTMTIFNGKVSSAKKNAPQGVAAQHLIEAIPGQRYEEVLSWVQKTIIGAQR